MRKVIFLTFAAGVILTQFTGCLKDKGFENKEYGTEVIVVKGVAFPQASKSPVSNSVTAQAAPIPLQGPYLTLEHPGAASSDVHITLELDSLIVKDAGYAVFPDGTISVNSLNVTIPAGQKSTDAIKLSIDNSLALDPDLEYGIGFRIKTVDEGYIIASNQKEVIFTLSIKNKYDGNYEMTFKSVGWAAYGISDNLPGTWPSTDAGYSIGMVTKGKSSVRMYDYWGFEDFIQVAFTSGNTGATGFGATAPRFIFDPATDLLVDVVNDIPDDGRGRAFEINPAITDSRYDPTTKKIYAAYIMKQNGRPNQYFYDTLTYISPRPE